MLIKGVCTTYSLYNTFGISSCNISLKRVKVPENVFLNTFLYNFDLVKISNFIYIKGGSRRVPGIN